MDALGRSHTARLAAPPYEEELPTDRVGPALYAIHAATHALLDLYSDGYGRELAQPPSLEDIKAAKRSLDHLHRLLGERYYQEAAE